jgi:rhodanese-related sulfurtransferase
VTMLKLHRLKGIYLVDAREPEETAAGVIMDAIAIPGSQNTAKHLSASVPPGAAGFIIYARTREAAKRSADALSSITTNIYIYENGWLEWKLTGLPISPCKQPIQ